ncbi:MAG: GGDEF and EAL domain-containing protein [Alphaproteobacteria bacterium]
MAGTAGRPKVVGRRSDTDDPWIARALRASGDIVYTWSLDTGAVRWSEPADSAFRLSTASLMADRDAVRSRIHPDDAAAVEIRLGRHLATAEPFEVEYRVRAGDGRYVWVHDRGGVLPSDESAAREFLGVMRVVTPQVARDARLERLVNYDELTGHYNQRRLREQLELTGASARRYGMPCAFLFVVIDDLPLLAEAYGRDVADAAIVTVGQQLDLCLRESDVTGRVGADSFGVILDGCPEHDIAPAMAKVTGAVAAAPVPTAVGPLRVTVSVGAVAIPGADHTALDIIDRAEQRARAGTGRGSTTHHAPRKNDRKGNDVRHDLAMAERVRWCLDNDAIGLAFQPVIDGATGRIAFHECLLRPAAASGLADNAGPLVRAAERIGLVRQIDRHVLDLVVRELEDDPDLVLSLNVSGLTTADQAWLRRLVALARQDPALPSRLLVEITETAAIRDLDACARFVASLRDLGCRVALDDFGAGHTSFRTLKALAIDMVKIDGSFVTGLAHQPTDVAFVRALADLAQTCGKATVAECVEDAATARVLKDCGVDYLQGFLYGRPGPRVAAPAGRAVVVAPG